MHKMAIAAGAVALALTGAAGAQETTFDEEGVTVLDQLLVTDGLTPVEQEKSGRAFTIITAEQLERSQVRYVADALRLVPGFHVSRTGSYGGLTQVRVRGGEGNHLKVLIDGVEAREASSDEFDFGGLVVDDIERIEILRGPQSAFWGSNAVSGVVNIITRRGERGGWTTRTRTEAGTDGTFLGGVAVSGGGDNYDIALSGLFRRNDGFNISDFGSEKDGDRNTTLNGRFTVDLTPDFTIDGTLRYVNRKSDTDPQDWVTGLVVDADEQTTTREFYGSLGATWVTLDGALTHRARLTGSDIEREFLTAGVQTYGTEGDRLKGSYQATYAFDTSSNFDARHEITGGYEWQRETFRTPDPGQYSRTGNSLVAQYRGDFADQFFLNVGGRYDFNDRFENVATYSASGAWKVPGTDTRLHASVGTGIANPTFFQQFGFIPTRFAGNPDLLPEESFGWDIGVEQTFFDGMLVADITYFNGRLKNEISGNGPTVINLDGTSKHQGVEVSARVDFFNGFTATASYTYLDASQQAVAGGPRTVQVRRPRHSGSLGMAYAFYDGRARVFADAVFNGRMEDDTSFVAGMPPRTTLSSYTVVNVGGSFKVNDNFEVYGRIENLFNENYQEVFGYNTPGRTAFIGLRGTF